MSLDAALAAAVASAVAPLVEKIDRIEALLVERRSEAPALESLASILGCSAGAARGQERRHGDLAALAIVSPSGRRLYRRAEVLQWQQAGCRRGQRP